MQPEGLSEGGFININEEVVMMKRMRHPRGSNTRKNFTLNRLSEIFHDTERGKANMLEADLQTQMRRQALFKLISVCDSETLSSLMFLMFQITMYYKY